MKAAAMKDVDSRSFKFAVRIVKLYRVLDEQPGVGRTLAKQLLRSGTSVGANVEEAQAGQSKADFISKMSISLKEARETLYWLRILEAAEVLPESRLIELKKEAEEITKILASIIVSARNNFKS